MERNIRDVRDIFGRSDGDSCSRKQELRSYEYSPRSRKKFESLDDGWDARQPHHTHHDSRTGGHKKDRHRQPGDHDPATKPHKKPVDDQQRTSNSKTKDASYYANRTLTERDIRHLERHLSMKKTIRKQISRNLAQAFVDEAELDLRDQPRSNKVPQDRTFTLTRAKVSKSEQNVLDLLKDNEPDSGHCSADNPNSSDDDSPQHELARQRPRAPEKVAGHSRSAADGRDKPVPQMYKEDGKFSFWKMFSVKSRGKR